MAEECTESSVATSSSAPPNWWDLHQPSSWSNANINNNHPWHQPNPNSNSSCDEDVSISTSFTNASNHSGLTVESSRRLVEPAASSSDELIGGEQGSDNHIWSHVLLSVGSNGDLQNHQDVGENFLDGLSSTKSMQTGMFEPACDYLKKLDHSTWEFTNSTSFNNFDKQMNGFNETMIENSERLTKLSNLVSTWSIAPPEPEVNRQFNPQTCNNNNISLNSSMDQYQQSNNLCHLKQTFNDSTSCEIGVNRNNSSLFPCYSNALKVESGHDQEIEAPGALLRRSFNGNGNNIGYQIGLNSSGIGDNSKYYYGMPDSYSSCTSARNFADVISFSSRLGKPLIDIHAPPTKPCFKSLNLSDSKKQGIQTTSPPTRMSGRGQGSIASEGKKKRSEDNSETSLKRPKQEGSTVSSVKMQAPKVKLGDRITALQQIVSPFGKTDTASVLLEAIQYIKFLQEQVQLLSNPYMKSNSHKDPWGSLDRKEKGDIKLDLRSRGLCLVPISCTPQVYRENTGSDYWTPTYRGCLYR